jgi:hypothetical protein
MKNCKHCNRVLDESRFSSREDGWGLYSWCDDCRISEGRDKVDSEIQTYLDKTRVFTDV